MPQHHWRDKNIRQSSFEMHQSEIIPSLQIPAHQDCKSILLLTFLYSSMDKSSIQMNVWRLNNSFICLTNCFPFKMYSQRSQQLNWLRWVIQCEDMRFDKKAKGTMTSQEFTLKNWCVMSSVEKNVHKTWSRVWRISYIAWLCRLLLTWTVIWA